MRTPAYLFKASLFACLFCVSMRFIHTYPLPMTVSQQQRLIEIAAKFGVTDTEGFYLSAVAMINLIAASAEYLLLMAFWRRYVRSRQKP